MLHHSCTPNDGVCHHCLPVLGLPTLCRIAINWNRSSDVLLGLHVMMSHSDVVLEARPWPPGASRTIFMVLALALASEPMALASEPMALASEPMALASEPMALALAPVALASKVQALVLRDALTIFLPSPSNSRPDYYY